MDRNLNENDKHKIGKNDHDARELHTYADNHADLHRQRITPIHKNLRNKMAQGKYDHDKAHKAFSYAAKDAADRYKKEHGHTFSKADRDKVAGAMRDQFHDEAKDGHHDHHLHKKYKGHKVESVQHDLEESNASLLKKFQSNIKDFQSFGKASGMSPRDMANMTKQLMSIHGMLKKGDVRGAKKMSAKLGGVASDIIPAKLMREDVQLDEKFDLARRALVNAGVPHMGERKTNKLKVHSKFKDTAQNVMKKFKGLDLEINDRMPEKPMKREDVEQVDELDAGTLIRYNNKASAQVTRDLKTAGGRHTPKTNKRMKGILKARKKLDKIMPGLRAEEVSEEMTDAQMKKKERIVKAMKEKRPQSYFMKKYGKDGKDVMYATATKLAMKDHVEWEEILESDEKPLMRWFAQFEREIKKHGMKYKSVDPVKMLKLYYRNVNPKNAAAILSGKGKGSEADYAAMEAVSEAKEPAHFAKKRDDGTYSVLKNHPDGAIGMSHGHDKAAADRLVAKHNKSAEARSRRDAGIPDVAGKYKGQRLFADVDHEIEEQDEKKEITYLDKKRNKKNLGKERQLTRFSAQGRRRDLNKKYDDYQARYDQPGVGMPEEVEINESLEIHEDGHADVASARRQCETISEDANQIDGKLKTMSLEDSLPTWWTNKLAVASNNMNKMRDYLLVDVSEDTDLEEKNVPNDPKKWAASKAAAKRKFDVYPSAYANAWASKDYKSKGGTWRKEDVEYDQVDELEKNESLGDEDKPTVKKIIKKLKGASQAHAGQAKDLEKAMKTDEQTDHTVDSVANWITFMKRNA